MSRQVVLLWVAVLAAASIGLYVVKYRVQALETDLTDTAKTLRAEREAIHVLEAEWAYLNRPDRLAELAARHLNLAPVSARQIRDLNSLPFRPERSGVELEAGLETAGAPPVAANPNRDQE